MLNFSSEQAKYFLEKSDDAVCAVSSTGELLLSNPAAEKLFGISAQEGIKIWDAIPYVEENDELIELFISAVTQKLSSQEAVVDYVNNSGKVYNLHVRLNYYKDDLALFFIVITDLTNLISARAAFARYTSPDIADYVLMTSEGQKRGGINQDVTIMMSDLRGFTALSSKLPAQELIDLLNHYFEKMVAVIEKYHGTVIEFLGDGIFVVFGAPRDLPDHASLAVKCAIEMQNAMREVNAWNHDNGFPDLEMGIGINSGNVVIGNIGSDKKMKYGCIGSAVNIAGRVESLTVGGQILITDNTAVLVTEKLTWKSESSFLPKGAKEDLKYYELAGVGDLELISDDREIIWKEGIDEDLDLYTLEGKVVSEQAHKVRIISLSDDRKHAIIKCGYKLSDMSNIMIQRQDTRIYAKVIEADNDGFLICFTSDTREL